MIPSRVISMLCLLIAAIAPAQAQQEAADLSPDALERLMNVEVTTVSRIPEKRSRVPAAVYVITQEDIRRSGVTSVVEALRLASGVQVARINSNQWAVGIRGFASRLSRSMLVLIDGRAVYSPLFAGTYWEVQDLPLENIDRIEVIRGPGGILWGANAVSGIINIVTREAKETQGTLLTMGGGSEERGFASVRYGGRMGADDYYRFDAKFFNRDAAFHPGHDDYDSWRMGQGGFRADWSLPEDRKLSIFGDWYRGSFGERTAVTTYVSPFTQVVQDDATFSGGDLISRWSGPLGERSDFQGQIYYDRTNHHEPTFQEDRDTVDVDVQQHFRSIHRNEFTWGLGYRMSSGEVHSVPTIQFSPARRTDHLFSGFLQDELQLLADHLYLIGGIKMEHNGYSGFEAQPNGKLLWTPSARQTVRFSIARAVRTPSRVERDLTLTTLLLPSLPAFLRLVPNPDFDSEKLHAYEFGYRLQPVTRLALNFAAFYNDYDDLVSNEVGTPFIEAVPPSFRVVLPLQWSNGLEGKSYGGEWGADWRPTNWWRLSGSYSYLRIDLRHDASSSDSSTAAAMEGASPRHQVSVQSFLNLPRGYEFDSVFRYVSALPSQKIAAYESADMRLGWRPRGPVELSLQGQNLLAPHHTEFGGGVQIERSFYAKVTWKW